MEKAIFFEEIYALPGVAAEGGLDKAFSWLADLGLDGLQFSEADLAKVGEERIIASMKRAGLAASVIHTLPRLLAEDDGIFAAAVAHVREAMALCERAGCHRLMLVPLPRSDVKGSEDLPRAKARMMEGLRILQPEAAARGITLYFENFSTLCLPYGSLENVVEILDAVPGTAYCFDTGNFLCTHTDVLAAYERLAARTVMIHVKDFTPSDVPTDVRCDDGGYMLGVPICTGNFDMRGFLAMAKRTTQAEICVLEHNARLTHEGIERSIRALNEFFV